jgi:hypothetical protein
MRATMPATTRAALAVAMIVLATSPASARCALDDVIGYTLVFTKTIEGFIEGGRKTRGFQGCQPGRVLVFADNSGVRCNGLSLQKLDFPKGYLFAKSQTDLKICIGDEMLDVSPAY